MKVLSIDLDYIMGPSINLYDASYWEHNPLVRWKMLFDNTSFKDSHFNIDQGNLLFAFETFLKAIKNTESVMFAYDHDSILYQIGDCEDIELVNIDHHDDVVVPQNEFNDTNEGYRHDYRCVRDYDRVNEGNWVSWLQVKNKLKNYFWISNDTSENWKDNIIKEFIPNYRRNTRNNIEITDYNFDHVFVCLSPQYTPKIHWHYMTMFMMAYEEYSGKKVNLQFEGKRKFEQEVIHRKVDDEVLYKRTDDREQVPSSGL